MTLAAEPTIGRDPELAVVDGMLAGLAEGGLLCVAVQGDPGIGKTRLLRELRDRAGARGHRCLAGSSSEFERDLPFGVWEDALDAHVASLEAEWDADLTAQLGGVLPSLRGGDGAATALVDERYRVHRAMRTLLTTLAADQPLVIVLDDLHWSDDASIELISSVLQRGVDGPVLLALGFRSGRVPPGLNSALARPLVRIIDLGPLGESDTLTLAGAGLDAERRRAIFAESGGNPFYIEQLARAPAGSAGSGADGVPRTVAAALRGELEGLDAQPRRFLEAAAVAGDPFDPEHAAEIAEVDPAAAIDALDALLAARLLRATDVPRRFAFRHPLVRRAVYESAPGGWRLLAHGRAAADLAARGGSAAGRAHHVEQSASPGDAAAIAVLLAAASETASSAPAVAAHWLTAALRLIPDADVPGRIAVLVDLASARRHVGDLEGCRSRLLEALDLLPPDEVDMRTDLTAAYAVTEMFLGRHDEAHRRLLAALEHLPDRRSPAAVTTLLSMAIGAFFTMRTDDLRRLAGEALETATALGDPALILSGDVVVALAAAMAGDRAAAEAARAKVVAAFSQMSDAELALHDDDVHRLVWTEFYMGRYEDVIATASRGVAVARASGRGEFVPLMTQAQALSEMMGGRLDRAEELQERAVEGARLARIPYLTGNALAATAQIATLKGDVATARQAAEESLVVAPGETRGIIVALAATQLAVLMLDGGATPERVDEVIARVDGWELSGLAPVWQAKYQEAKVRADIAGGRLEDASVAAARAEDAAERSGGLPIVVAYARRARAAVLLAGGDAAAAARVGSEGAACADEAGTPIEGAWCRLVAGQALSASGSRAEAVALLRAAESALDGFGAVRLRDGARRELRKLGARAEKRGPATGADSGVESLTAREREIADLVCDRRTNREIAATLFLSDKTIESHLRNVFVKLGVSSRVDVARAVERFRG
ncbi:MAG TPA: AAA family ATPase [Solirubrobacteraceae bacterium]|jgi:DNA-binding CsgD family transcriptional regulator